MTPLFAYLVKVIICSGIFYGYYHIALRNNRFHQWNRYYLLLCTLLSLAVPLMRIPLSFSPEASAQSIYVYTMTLREQVFTAAPVAERVDWTMWIYISIITICLLRLAFSYLKIMRIIYRGQVEPVQSYRFVFSEAIKAPFSFFRYIFLHQPFNPSTTQGRQMLQHEMVHAQEKHSLDKLIMEFITAACWINPFFHLMKWELSLVHEFIADKKVVKDGDVADYAETILQMALQTNQHLQMTNSFLQHPIKRRIFMLTQYRNLRFSYLRRLMILPIGAMIFCSLAFVIRQEQQEKLDLQNKAIAETIDVQQQPQQDDKKKPQQQKPKSTQKTTTSQKPAVEDIKIAPPPPPAPGNDQQQPKTTNGKPIFTFVENPPTFPGGDEALAKYLSSNIHYPHEATEKGIQGTIFVSYVVTPEGAITDVKTIGAPKGGGLEEEAIRVVKMMPKWNPGKQNGQNVNVQFNLPIRFTLQEQGNPRTEAPVFSFVETAPRFPGGEEKLNQYIRNTLRYPHLATENKVTGTVFVSFVVGDDGSVRDVKTVGAAKGYGLEEEAIRMVKMMPKWIPGKQGGRNVNVQFNLPVKFALQDI